MCDGDDRDARRSTVDLVDHTKVTSTRAVQAVHVEPKGFANSARVPGESAVDKLDAGSRSLLQKSIEGTQGAGRPIDLVHVALRLIDPRKRLLTGQPSNTPFLGILATRADSCHERRIAQNLQRLFERLQVLNAEHYRRGASVFGDHDPSVLTFEAVDDFG